MQGCQPTTRLHKLVGVVAEDRLSAHGLPKGLGQRHRACYQAGHRHGAQRVKSNAPRVEESGKDCGGARGGASARGVPPGARVDASHRSRSPACLPPRPRRSQMRSRAAAGAGAARRRRARRLRASRQGLVDPGSVSLVAPSTQRTTRAARCSWTPRHRAARRPAAWPRCGGACVRASLETRSPCRVLWPLEAAYTRKAQGVSARDVASTGGERTSVCPLRAPRFSGSPLAQSGRAGAALPPSRGRIACRTSYVHRLQLDARRSSWSELRRRCALNLLEPPPAAIVVCSVALLRSAARDASPHAAQRRRRERVA